MKHIRIDENDLKDSIIDAIHDKKGKEVVSLDLRSVNEAITNYFIICHGDSNTQVRAIADNVQDKIKKQKGELPTYTEGYNNLQWVLLDYVDIVVHVFYKEARMRYQLEDLWNDAEVSRHEPYRKIG